MSHIVKVKTKIQNNEALALACKQVGATAPEVGKCDIFGTHYSGTFFKLPGWRYPICISPNGTLNYDNYRGRWGDKKLLDEVLQRYTANVTVRNLVRQGFRMQGVPTIGKDGTMRVEMVAS